MELTQDQALEQAIVAHREGKLQDAERLYRAILQSNPNHPDANHNLGVLAVTVGKPLDAVPLFKLALEANPKVEQFWLSYTEALIKAERFDEAKRVLIEGEKSGVALEKLELLRQQIPKSPPNKNKKSPRQGLTVSEKRKKLAERKNKKKAQQSKPSAAVPAREQVDSLFAYYQSRRLTELEELAVKLTKQFPAHQIGWKALGIALRETGRLSESIGPTRRSVELRPEDPESHNNLGTTLKELGKLDEAEESYRQAIALKPDFAEAHNNLGVTLYELGRLAEAEASLRQAIALKPDFAEAHSNLGATLQDAGRLEEAEASNRQAIKLKPDFAEAYCNLCDLFLKTNKTDKLLPVLDQARSAISGVKADFLYFEALASFQTEHYEEADTLVAQITDDEVSKIRKAPYYKLVGDLRHRDQDYDAAFFAYESSNQAVKSGLEYKRLEREAGHYFESLKNTARQLEQLLIGSPISERPFQDARQPTFLVGFPRSGTTLLDTILRTHSRVQVIEEQPMVSKMIATLGDLQDVSEIESIDKGRLSVASNAYFEELKKHTDSLEESILVDKLPLNLLHAPLLNQIFPNAKFILSLRHPLDCSLSCWMQNFKLNPAMANMVDLNRIVDFYCVAMEIFKMSQRRYGLNVHSVRYEDLVKDFEGEITSLLGFLGLEWHAGILDYQATAAERERINTPSYSQVIKPIYKTASYRWKYYEKYLDEFKPRLMPWLKEYGYAA